MAIAATASISVGVCEVRASVIEYNVAFGPSANAYAAAINPTNGVAWIGAQTAHFNALEAESFTLSQAGSPTYTLSFNSINNYNTGNDAHQPLVTEGIFAPNGSDSSFTLTGLTAGDTVSLYAIDAWDGSGRAGIVTLTNGTTTGTGDTSFASDNTGGGSGGVYIPGASPLNSDFQNVATDMLVPNSGTLNGTISAGDRAEGQIGGFVVEVTQAAIPEPSTLMFGAPLGALLCVRCRRIATARLL